MHTGFHTIRQKTLEVAVLQIFLIHDVYAQYCQEDFYFLIYGLYTLDNAFLVGVDEEYSFSPGKFYP